jgi:hypothetical protein
LVACEIRVRPSSFGDRPNMLVLRHISAATARSESRVKRSCTMKNEERRPDHSSAEFITISDRDTVRHNVGTHLTVVGTDQGG